MSSGHDVQPSYFGFVENRDDAVMLIQACMQGRVLVVQRRPTLCERPFIPQSGHIFIYEENVSGIRRWTDGRHWSRSRISSGFFIYGERSASPHQSHTGNTEKQSWLEYERSKEWYQRLYGPLAKSFNIQPDVLVKKTIRVQDLDDSGAVWHLISYFRPVDVLAGRLQAPGIYQDYATRHQHLPTNFVPFSNPASERHIGVYGTLPLIPSWDNSPTIHHHIPSTLPISEGTGHHQAYARQDPLSGLRGVASNTLFWSPGGQQVPNTISCGMRLCDDGSF